MFSLIGLSRLTFVRVAFVSNSLVSISCIFLLHSLVLALFLCIGSFVCFCLNLPCPHPNLEKTFEIANHILCSGMI